MTHPKTDAVRKLKTEELQRLSPDAFRRAPKLPLVVILDDVRSGLNVGAAFRTADAFALQALYLCGITARPPHREILKTAIGASATVAWKYFESAAEAVRHAKQQGMTVYAVEQTDDSTPLHSFVLRPQDKGVALVFGNEVTGVSDDVLALVDGAIEILQFGTKHSLNISVAIGIVTYECQRQLRDQ